MDIISPRDWYLIAQIPTHLTLNVYSHRILIFLMHEHKDDLHRHQI